MIFAYKEYRCKNCGCTILEPLELNSEGSIVTYTVIRVAPEKFASKVPYTIAIIKLREGAHIAAFCPGEFDDTLLGKPVTVARRDDIYIFEIKR